MRMILAVCLLVGCERIEATGNPTQPVTAVVATPSPDSVEEVAPEPIPAFLEDDPVVPEDPEVLDPIALLALQQGIEIEPPEVVLDVEPEAVEGEIDDSLEPPVYAWDPETAPPSTWGIRLLSTVNSTLPPRAVIGLPDGSEQVVQPGAMLPDQRVIVLAIGIDVIQIAQVIPDGVQARIETKTVTSLFPK